MIQEASRCSLLQGFVDEAAAEKIYQFHTTRAYRLEPLQESGILAVDGEVIDYTPVQVTMHQSVATVYG